MVQLKICTGYREIALLVHWRQKRIGQVCIPSRIKHYRWWLSDTATLAACLPPGVMALFYLQMPCRCFASVLPPPRALLSLHGFLGFAPIAALEGSLIFTLSVRCLAFTGSHLSLSPGCLGCLTVFCQPPLLCLVSHCRFSLLTSLLHGCLPPLLPPATTAHHQLGHLLPPRRAHHHHHCHLQGLPPPPATTTTATGCHAPAGGATPLPLHLPEGPGTKLGTTC